jgi:uncharacterized protein YycO
MSKKSLIIIFILIGIVAGYTARSLSRNKITKNDSSVISKNNASELQDGDIIFQSSKSGQSLAVQLATNSIYSHCGIIFKEGNEYVVYEALQPVKKTPLSKFIDRGDDDKYVVKRLSNANQSLTPTVISLMKTEVQKQLGKNYDLTFEWSDDKIYCSELVWKTYQRCTGLEVGITQHLKDFDLSHPEVKKIVEERYGKNIPLEETVISPGAIFESKQLITVKEN